MKETTNMGKRELICSVLESMGYKPELDRDGDVYFRHQMKNYYVMVGMDSETYLSVIFPQFYEIEEGEDALVLAACNKVSRDIRMVKVYIDQTYKSVSASCEFYYTDEDAMEYSLGHSLKILGMIRSTFRNVKKELCA